jgi:hypothetical protein
MGKLGREARGEGKRAAAAHESGGEPLRPAAPSPFRCSMSIDSCRDLLLSPLELRRRQGRAMEEGGEAAEVAGWRRGREGGVSSDTGEGMQERWQWTKSVRRRWLQETTERGGLG